MFTINFGIILLTRSIFFTFVRSVETKAFLPNFDLLSIVQRKPKAIPRASEPADDKPIYSFLGWPLELVCQAKENVKWSRWNDDSQTWTEIQTVNQTYQFYSVEENILFIPVTRPLFENNTIFKCESNSVEEKFKIVVHGCENNPCKRSGTCVLINEVSGVPVVSCECKEKYKGELCDSEVSSSPIWVLMMIGLLLSVGLIAIAALVLKKRKKDSIVRKLVGSSPVPQKSQKSVKSSKMKSYKTSKITKNKLNCNFY